MSSIALAVTDSATMLRRNLRHMRRYPTVPLLIIGMPVVFLMLFVYVFGATLGAGLGHPGAGRAAYAGYAPSILLSPPPPGGRPGRVRRLRRARDPGADRG